MSASRPEWAPVRDRLAHILKTYGHERVELEFRLGHRLGGRFVPGVTEPAWRALKAKLDASKAFEVVVVNTRELLSDDGSGGKYVVPQAAKPHWMHKTRLLDHDVDTDEGPWCCRTSVSLEVVEPPERQAPPPKSHKFERVKERYSYKHRCWSLDLTRVVSNLPHQLDSEDATYEIELELADTSELFVRTLDNVLDWAWIMVCDMCAFMRE